jgi:hypothetical protein
MTTDRSLSTRQGHSLTVLREADVQHVGALILSTLDRLGVINQDFSRIMVYGRRVIVFELPRLAYADARDLIVHQAFGRRLTHLLTSRVVPQAGAGVALRRLTQGCAVIVDLR